MTKCKECRDVLQLIGNADRYFLGWKPTAHSLTTTSSKPLPKIPTFIHHQQIAALLLVKNLGKICTLSSEFVVHIKYDVEHCSKMKSCTCDRFFIGHKLAANPFWFWESRSSSLFLRECLQLFEEISLLHLQGYKSPNSSQHWRIRQCVSWKRQEHIIQPHGATIHKVYFLNNHTVETSTLFLYRWENIYFWLFQLSHSLCFLDAWLIFLERKTGLNFAQHLDVNFHEYITILLKESKGQ